MFGTLIGNFATTAYYRLPRKISLFGFDQETYNFPMCSNCGTSLKFYEYLPLLSWVSTLGTCNYCGKRIDSSYTFLEAATGFSSTLLYHFLGFTESYILLVCITSILILKLLLYRKCQRVWLALTITFAFLAVALRVLNEGTLYNCLLNIFLGIIILYIENS